MTRGGNLWRDSARVLLWPNTVLRALCLFSCILVSRATRFHAPLRADHVTKRNEGSGNENGFLADTRQRAQGCEKQTWRRWNDHFICNGNRTKWSPIRSVIIRVITKSDDRAAGVRFVHHEYDYRQNWTTQSSVTN